MNTKTWKRPLRTLSATQLQSVAGGIIGILSGSTVTSGGLTTTEYKPAESMRLFPDTGESSGGGPHV